MNPDTGQFYGIDDSSSPKRGTVKSHVAKEKGWPIFEIGETIEVKGYPFELLHVKISTGRIILRPKSQGYGGGGVSDSLDKYRCKHGVLGYCELCWAEGFRQRRLYYRQVEELRKQEQERKEVAE